MKRITFARLAVLMLAVAGLALQGCGGDDERVRVETVEVPVEVPADPEIVEVPVEVPDDSGIEGVQQRAADAASAAKMASDNAAASAKGAMDATMNIATLQTGGMAMDMAAAAQKAADGAMMAYEAAKAASDAAAAATTTEGATEEAVKAEAAQAKAEMYEMTADEKGMGAIEAAGMELMIDGKMKSVGDSMLHAGDGMLTVTDDDDAKTITGRMMSMDPMNMVAAKDAVDGAQDNPNTMTMDEAVTPMAAVEAKSVTIGRTLDSRDDMARLMLVTHYAGSKLVRTFDYSGAATDAANTVSTTDGRIQVAGAATADDATDDVFSPLVYKGMYYLATGATADDGLANATDAADTVADNSVAAAAKPMRVYSYQAAGTDTIPGNADDVTTYVVLHSSTTPAGGMTTNTYRNVDVTVQLAAVPAVTAATDIALPVKEVPLMADISQAKAYEHLHFGVWANLGAAKANGSQMIDGHGIGFVQSIGDGMTEVMLNKGMATYNGDWVATVQEADKGAVTLESGGAMLTANLDKSTLAADLDGLAMLEGTLDGSTFSGMKAAVDADNVYGLTPDGTFTGSFSGGFYGDGAVEAGGIFDFTSEGIADGAFRGAFGARIMEDN